MASPRQLVEAGIVGVAVRDQHGEVHTLPPPNRHHNVLLAMHHAGLHCPDPADQGFVLDDGSFVNRGQAYLIAWENGQLLPRPAGGYNGPELYSEDLW